MYHTHAHRDKKVRGPETNVPRVHKVDKLLSSCLTPDREVGGRAKEAEPVDRDKIDAFTGSLLTCSFPLIIRLILSS